MAAIVYEGLPGNGDLFAGKKFFIIQRVPIRNTLIQYVESNGGEVVALEKQAHMIIADHARPKFAPPNYRSYSWKYIENSVKNGVLEDPEQHLIHKAFPDVSDSPATGTPAYVVGRSAPIKRTKTPFTAADNDLLRRWVAKKCPGGQNEGGNAIYQELAARNPRHTWQSWKDRYMRYYRGKAPPDVSNDDFEDLEPATESVAKQPAPPFGDRHIVKPSQLNKAAGEPMRPKPQYTSAPVRRAPTRAASPIIEEEDDVPPVIENQEFSQEDHELLEQEYEHIAEVERKETQIIAAWLAFEKEQGRHTGQEWRNYFMKAVKPCMESKLRRAVIASEKKAVAIGSEDDEEEGIYEREDVLPPLNMESPQTAQLSGRTLITPKNSSKISAIPAKLSRSARIRVEEEGRNFVSIPPRDEAVSEDDIVSENHAVLQDKAVSEDKAAFLEDLRTIARLTHKQIEPIQKVLGRQVQLYKLYTTVNDQKRFRGFNYVEENNLWPEIVPYVLGSCGPDRLAVGKALRDLYTTFLVRIDPSAPRDSTAGSSMTPATYFEISTTSSGRSPSVANAVTKNQVGAHSQAPPCIRSGQRFTDSPQRPTDGARHAADNMVNNPQRYAKEKSSAASKPLSIMTLNDGNILNQSLRERQKNIHAESIAEPTQQVMGETLETFMKNVSNETDHRDELTDADKAMLGKLVFFAKEVFNINIEVTGIPIRNRYISLPRFRKVVNKYGGYNTVTEQNLWARVAKDLGYGVAARNANLFAELKEIYNEILKDFDIWQEKVRKERERRSRLPVEEQRRLAERKSVVVFRHSPPRGSSRVSQKQSRDILEMASQNVPDTFKRRRLDRKGKGKEILDEVPATPEHIYNSSWQSQEASAIEDSQKTIELSSDTDSDNVESIQPINRALFKGRARTATPEMLEEPETQEFSFISPDSPSEQLHSEVISTAQSPVQESRKRDSSQTFDDKYDEGAAEGDSDLEDYYHRCKVSGYSAAVASRSLAYANQDINLAKKIWNRVARGLPIPDNVPGLWPTTDDDILWAGLPDNHPKMKELIQKHGRMEVEDRKDTLQMLGEAETQ